MADVSVRRTTIYRRSGGLAVLVAAAAVALAACGGATPTSAASSTTVASLPTSGGNGDGGSTATGGGHSATTLPKGNATKLLNEWATCMHSHGDPNQADPIVDAYGVINITIPGDGADAARLSGEVHAGADPCDRYVAAAQAALRAANPVSPPPDQTELVKYTECMRANGVPNYPYPTANMTFQGTGVDPYSPHVQNVNKLCGTKLALPGWWISGNGPPGDVSVGNIGPTGNPPGNPPPCFYQTSGCPKPAQGGNLPPRGGNSGAAAGG